MFRIGEIKTGKELGYISTERRIWLACKDCGKTRWVRLVKGKPERDRCPSCARKGERNVRWIGGRFKISRSGYIMIRLNPDDFFYPMCRKSDYVLEHRLVMAKYLERCLLPWEIVHHRNGIKDDNRLENLRLFNLQSQHLPSIKIEQEIKRQAGLIKQLQSRVTLLEAENILLKEQMTCEESYV